jgi:hypothetical protein
MQQQPDAIGRLTETTAGAVDRRRNELVDLCDSIARYLERGQRVDGVLNQLRLVSQKRLTGLLLELESVCRAYGADLESIGARAPELPGIEQVSSWERLIGALRSPTSEAAMSAAALVDAGVLVARTGWKRISDRVAISRRRPENEEPTGSD